MSLMDRDDLRRKLELDMFSRSGYKTFSGGYADIPEDTFCIDEDEGSALVRATGLITRGLRDMGSGHSERITDEFDFCLRVGEDFLRYEKRDLCSHLEPEC
jgi:hypothetical protein